MREEHAALVNISGKRFRRATKKEWAGEPSPSFTLMPVSKSSVASAILLTTSPGLAVSKNALSCRSTALRYASRRLFVIRAAVYGISDIAAKDVAPKIKAIQSMR